MLIMFKFLFKLILYYSFLRNATHFFPLEKTTTKKESWKDFFQKLENKKMCNIMTIKLWYEVIWLEEFSKTEGLSETAIHLLSGQSSVWGHLASRQTSWPSTRCIWKTGDWLEIIAWTAEASSQAALRCQSSGVLQKSIFLVPLPPLNGLLNIKYLRGNKVWSCLQLKM